MGPFQYLKLNPTGDEFRLFMLKPGAPGSTIEGVLEHHPVQTSSSYQGLSYVWGNPTDAQTIFVDGRSLSVTSNLHEALQHIRHIDRSIRLWIDAICIDQRNMIERSQQVHMMKAIFSRADSVVAWIGPSSGLSGAAMKLISRFANSTQDAYSLLERAESEGANIQHSANDLFRRPYWGRVWIVQELATARAVLVRCGQYSAPLEAFQTFITTLSSRLGTIANYMSVTKASRLLKLVKLYRERWASRQRLIDILWSTVEFQATDERDRVYAILGIGRPEDQKALPPDYTLASTPSSLLRKLVKHHLETEDDLDILCYFPPLSTRFHNGCSWLPDLTQHIHGLCPAPFTASASRRPDFRFSADLRELTLKGISLATVDTVVGPFDFTQFLDLSMEKKGPVALSDSDAFMSLENAALQALHSRVFPSATKSSVEDYFWNTIVGDNMVIGAEGPDAPYPCGYLEFWESLLPRSCDEISQCTNGSRQGKEISIQQAAGNFAEGLDGAARHLERVFDIASLMRLSGRCFFITADQKAGLGPADLKRGDAITIMFGSGLPFVLREFEAQFRLIGPAYVYGAMRGEFLEEMKADSADIREFTLI